eukprot:936951-Alexandrium_andersonii.AAC.1
MTKLYQSQLERGAHFLHEHPALAASWQEPCVAELLGRPEVESGIGHMCVGTACRFPGLRLRAVGAVWSASRL